MNEKEFQDAFKLKAVDVIINGEVFMKQLIPLSRDYVEIVACKEIPIYCRESIAENIPAKIFTIPVYRTNRGWVANLDSEKLFLEGDFLKYKEERKR